MGSGRSSSFTNNENGWRFPSFRPFCRARSSIDAFQSLGYTVLFTYDVVETILVYQAFPDLVTALIMDAPDVAHCLTYGIPKVLSKDDMKFNPIVLDTKQAAVILKEQAAAGLQQDEMLIGGGNDKKIGWRGFRVNPDDQLKGCVKRKGFEDGIPLWKMFSLHFWANPWHPVSFWSYISAHNIKIQWEENVTKRNS